MAHIHEAPFSSFIARAFRMLVLRFNREFVAAGHDVTIEQVRLLKFLALKDGPTQQELAACTFKDKTSITRLLDNLEKRNLIQRRTDTEDKRNRRIYLTGTGKRLQQKLSVMAEKVMHEITSGIPEDELNICKKVLQQITDKACQ